MDVRRRHVCGTSFIWYSAFSIWNVFGSQRARMPRWPSSGSKDAKFDKLIKVLIAADIIQVCQDG